MRKPDRTNSGVIFRCAIYTRKSSDDGLEQEFNSLDARRESYEAYITSQRHAGWIALADMYDDGGLSGGTMERPALRRLLSDMKTGKVQIIVEAGVRQFGEWGNTEPGRHILIAVARYLAARSPTERAWLRRDNRGFQPDCWPEGVELRQALGRDPNCRLRHKYACGASLAPKLGKPIGPARFPLGFILGQKAEPHQGVMQFVGVCGIGAGLGANPRDRFGIEPGGGLWLQPTPRHDGLGAALFQRRVVQKCRAAPKALPAQAAKARSDHARQLELRPLRCASAAVPDPRYPLPR